MESKKIKNRTELLLFIFSVLAVIIAINYLGTRRFGRIDMTESKQYSISDATRSTLQNLDGIVNIKVFFSKNLPAHMHTIVSDVRDMLSEYQAYGGRNIRVTWKDPAESEEVRNTARTLGIDEVRIQSFEKDKAQIMAAYLGIAVLFEDRKEALPVVQNLQSLEYDLTQAIMKVIRTTAPKVGVLRTDDGSMPPPMQGMQPQASQTEQLFEPLYQKLGENYQVTTVDLSKQSSIETDIATLIIPGVAEFSDDQLYAIDQYFMAGGNLIVLADGVDVSFQMGIRAQEAQSPLFDMLEHYGVKVEHNLILDPSCGQVTVPQEIGNFRMNVDVPYPYFVRVGADGFNEANPAVSSVADAIFPWVSQLSLKVNTTEETIENPVQPDVTASVLISSTPQSWAARGHFNLDPQQNWMQPAEDQLSSYPLAAHLAGSFTSYFDSEGQPTQPVAMTADSDDPMSQINLQPQATREGQIASNTNGQLVVFGDAEFVSNQNATYNNLALMVNLVDWLSLDNNLISIRSRVIRDNTIESDLISEGTTMRPNLIRVLNILLMPAIVVLFGFVIFIKRKEKTPVSTSVSENKEKNNEQ